MKLSRMLFILPTIISIFGFQPSSDYTFAFSTSELGPYTLGEYKSEDITVKITNQKMIRRYNVVLEVFVVRDGLNRSIYLSSPSSIRIFDSMNYSITDFSYYMGKSPTTFRFEISEDGRITDIYGVTLTATKNATINANDYKENYYETPVFYGKFEDTYFTSYKEMICFDGLGNELTLKEPYVLDLSNLKIRYQYEQSSFKYKDAYILLPSIYGCFSDIKDYKIPLSFSIFEDEVLLSPPNSFFYDKTTFEISTSPKSGYKITNNFYLPKNKIKELDGMVLKIYLIEVGDCLNSFVYSIPFISSTSSIGDCAHNDYCVVGGIKE